MRIYAKKAFSLGPGLKREGVDIEEVVTVPMMFMDVPDSIVHDATFKLAVKFGEITVIETREQQNQIEKQEPAVVKEDLIKSYYETLKSMSTVEMLDEAKKYNVEVSSDEKASIVKKRVFEAYKIHLADAE